MTTSSTAVALGNVSIPGDNRPRFRILTSVAADADQSGLEPCLPKRVRPGSHLGEVS